MTTLWSIFCSQSKFFTYPGASTMLEDFACKALTAGFPENSVISAISEYYSQCVEIAQKMSKERRFCLQK